MAQAVPTTRAAAARTTTLLADSDLRSTSVPSTAARGRMAPVRPLPCEPGSTTRPVSSAASRRATR